MGSNPVRVAEGSLVQRLIRQLVDLSEAMSSILIRTASILACSPTEEAIVSDAIQCEFESH
jgi:hypothetical protein